MGGKPTRKLQICHVQRILANLSTEGSDSRVRAQIIITDDESPGLRSQLAMMMVGGAIMHSTRLLGGKGYLMAYKRLTRTPKMVHITAAFEREFPGAANIISCLAKQCFPTLLIQHFLFSGLGWCARGGLYFRNYPTQKKYSV